MGVILLVSLALMPFMFPNDPAPGPTRTRTASRDLECERVTAAAAARRFPGRAAATDQQVDTLEPDALVCAERLARAGLRSPRDEAALSTLDARINELTLSAAALRPDLGGRTWLVEAHHPSAQVAAKIDFAAKNALAGQGLAVSDRSPALSAGDVGVITRLAPADAYPAACLRYGQTGGMGQGDALLAVINLDPRETVLHAGICDRGRWMWLK